MKSAYTSCKNWCQSRGQKLAHQGWKPSSINNPQKEGYFPEFSSKAFDIKLITLWLAEQASQASDCDTPLGMQRKAIAWLGAEVINSMSSAPTLLTRNLMAKRRLLRACHSWLSAYTKRSVQASQQGETAWHAVPKLHMFAHMYEDAERDNINPLGNAGFRDEDFQQHAAAIVAGVHRAHAFAGSLERWFMYIQEVWAEWHVKAQN